MMRTLLVVFCVYWLLYAGSARSQSIIDTRKDNIQELFPLMINAGVTHIIIRDTIKSYNIEFINSKDAYLNVLDLSDATIGSKEYKLVGRAYSIRGKKSFEPNERTVPMEPANKLRSLSFNRLRFKKIILPKTLESIGSSVGWYSLTEIPLFPDSLKKIESSAFLGCSLMKGSIVLPPRIEIVGPGAFSGCPLLTGTVKIPISMDLTKSSGCFNGCSGLDGISFSKGSQYVFQEGFILTRDQRTVLSSSIPARPTVRLPKAVKEIHTNAFSNDRIVEKIICPKGLKKIGNRAFSSCHNLKKINLPEGLNEIGDDAFYECSISKLEIPSTVKRIKQTRWSGVDTLVLKSSQPCVLEEIGNPKVCLVVMVPKGAKKAYEKAIGWRQYKIEETE